MRAKALEVVYDRHINFEIFLEVLRKRKYGIYKAFGKWHEGDGNPHTHIGVVLRDKPQFQIATGEHKQYFSLTRAGGASDAEPLLPTLVKPLGKGNAAPVRKLAIYCKYLTDGHDNGTFKDSWNFKFDYELECCKTYLSKIYLRQRRGETFQEIYEQEEAFNQWQLLRGKKEISKTWQAHEVESARAQTAPRLRPFQLAILRRIKQQGDRECLWVLDPDGGAGKTWLLKYMAVHMGACVMNNAKKSDIAYHYNGEELVGINLTRTVGDRINYEAIEMLKDGLVFSGKYESSCYVRPFTLPPVKVVVMSNHRPDLAAMSRDRWDVVSVEDLVSYQKNLQGREEDLPPGIFQMIARRTQEKREATLVFETREAGRTEPEGEEGGQGDCEGCSH